MSSQSPAYIYEIGGDVKGIVGDVIGGVVNQYIIAQKSETEIHSRTLIKGSPYMGLNKFEPRDKDKFFGREQWIVKLSNHLEANNLLFLLGASGSGKSSLFQAGLIPHLSDQWGAARVVTLIFVPDKNPFESFYDSLPRKYKEEAAEIIEKKEPGTLVKLVKNLKEDSHKWLVFIDQFEELFTITPKLERDKFIASLVQLIKQQNNSVKLLMAMRSDFLDNLRNYADLINEVVNSKIQLVGELTEIELRWAIAEPAARNGVTFERGLVEQIVGDFYQQAGSLPLLQYTLDLLWEKDNISAQNRVLNIKTYEDLGGVSGALQQQANKIYEKLNDREKEAANKIFIELIDLSAREPVSRRAEISQFKNDPVIKSVLNRLIENRLLVSGRYKSTVEVAHEQLLLSWKALQDLILEQKDIIILRSRLINDAKQWHKLKKEDEEKAKDELWSGYKLERVLELIDKQTFSGLDKESEQFIQASVERRDCLFKEEEERRQKDLKIVGQIAELKEWKILQENFQHLSVQLSMMQTQMSSENYGRASTLLEINWQRDCWRIIDSYLNISGTIHNSQVKEELERNIRLLERLLQEAVNINSLVQKFLKEVNDKSKGSKNLKLRVERIINSLFNLERINSEFLQYLDNQVKVKISEMELDYEKLRIILG